MSRTEAWPANQIRIEASATEDSLDTTKCAHGAVSYSLPAMLG